MKLRENQVEPVRVGVEYFKSKNAVPSIIVAPTAFGKSIVIASIVKELKEKIIILQPSKELLEQNYNKYINLGGEAKIFSASLDTKEIGNVTYATVGSIRKAVNKVKELGITRIIIDECDRFPREPSGMLRSFLEGIDAKHILGLTATPLKLQTNRDMFGNPFSKLVMLTNRSSKGNFFKDILYVSQIKDILRLGYWTPIVYESIKFDASYLQFNTSKSDYTEDSVRISYRTQNLERTIVDKVSELNDRKAILIAVPNIDDAERLSSIIPDSAVLHSKLKKKDRDFIVSSFKSGAIRVVVQVNILTVGFDYPELDCLICARPTSSLSWWYQFVGRGTRIHPNKKTVLVIDMVDSLGRFGKVEDLVYEKEGNRWELYGNNKTQLTSVPIHDFDVNDSESDITMPFGKYKDRPINKIPKSYIGWLLENIYWREDQEDLKNNLIKEIE